MARLLSGDVIVKMSPVEVNKLMRDPAGIVVRHLLVDGEKVKIEAKRIAPFKTGNLRNHIVKRIVRVGGETAVIVGVDGGAVPYAYYVHEGAPAHIINGNPYLVFFWERNNRWVKTTQVHHPGNKPNRYLIRALRVIHD